MRIFFLKISIFFSLSFLIFFVGCKHAGNYRVQIFFPEKNNLFLVPVDRFVPEKTPQVLFNELEIGPRDHASLLQAFPSSLDGATITTHGSLIQVDFKSLPSLETWPMIIKSIKATFQQLQEFDTVEFLVQGQPGVISNGEELGKESLKENWVNDNLGACPGENSDTAAVGRVKVYFLLKGTPYFIPITRPVPEKFTPEEEITETLTGCSRFSWALDPPLPLGSKILSVKKTSNSFVEISAHFQGTKKEISRAKKAMVLSYTELPGVKYVRFKDGSILDYLFVENHPLSTNSEINKL